MNSPHSAQALPPSNDVIVRPTRNPFWRGFGWGWAAIAFTFLWVGVAFSALLRLSSNAGMGALVVMLMIAPTLGLSVYFAQRREWKGVLGVVFAWASVIVPIVLLIIVTLAIMSPIEVH